MFKLKFSMAALRVSLLKEGKAFLQTRLGYVLVYLRANYVSHAGIDFTLNEDTTIGLDVSLKELAVRDFYDSPWSDTLTTSQDDLAISLTFGTFNRARLNYPGHDMAIGVKMGAVRVAFTNRLVLSL
jgi:hypothetical protein